MSLPQAILMVFRKSIPFDSIFERSRPPPSSHFQLFCQTQIAKNNSPCQRWAHRSTNKSNESQYNNSTTNPLTSSKHKSDLFSNNKPDTFPLGAFPPIVFLPFPSSPFPFRFFILISTIGLSCKLLPPFFADRLKPEPFRPQQQLRQFAQPPSDAVPSSFPSPLLFRRCGAAVCSTLWLPLNVLLVAFDDDTIDIASSLVLDEMVDERIQLIGFGFDDSLTPYRIVPSVM